MCEHLGPFLADGVILQLKGYDRLVFLERCHQGQSLEEPPHSRVRLLELGLGLGLEGQMPPRQPNNRVRVRVRVRVRRLGFGLGLGA